MPITFLEPGHFGVPAAGDAHDVPTDLERIASRLAALLTAHTTATRDALAGTDLWVGRRIWNVTTGRIEVLASVAPVTWVAGGVTDHGLLTGLDDDDHPQYVLESTAAAKGDILVGAAAGVITRRSVGTNGRALVADSTHASGLSWADLQAAIDFETADVGTGESRASTSYGNLATVGPSVTVTVGASGALLVVISARIISAAAADGGLMAFALTGANTRGEADADVVRFMGAYSQRASALTLVTGLTAGNTTVIAKYASAAGASATFANRRVTAFAL